MGVGENEGYRPLEIFKAPNSFIYQRVFGEIHLDDEEVTHTKDNFQWTPDEEGEFLKKLKLKWRIILAYLLTDEAYAVSIRRFMKEPNHSLLHYHLLGTGLTLFVSWQIATLTGILLGGNLPQFLDMQFIIPLTFLAIIVPMINSISTFCAMFSSGVSSLYFKNLDLSLWILLAGIVGVSVGMITKKLDKEQ